MALQEPEGHGTAERVDHEIDIRVPPNLATLDRSSQHQARQLPAPPGELREKRRRGSPG